MTWTIPNILSVLRLLAAPMVAVMFLYFTRPYADWFALSLFLLAAVTDWFDGYLARAWGQETRMGAMIDPIADKAMVVIALMVIVGYSSMSPWLVLPATMIVFREVFISGLREFLGGKSANLAVTNLAKWKTTVQMVAVAALLIVLLFEHYLVVLSFAMDEASLRAILAGDLDDTLNIRPLYSGRIYMFNVGFILIWFAALLTAITGWDYVVKSRPYFSDNAE